MNDSNAIGKRSSLYKDLIDMYDCYSLNDAETHRKRYEVCYELADAADYKEICYVISQLKEVEDVDVTGLSELDTILAIIKRTFCARFVARESFILEILEEARERKRPTY